MSHIQEAIENVTPKKEKAETIKEDKHKYLTILFISSNANKIDFQDTGMIIARVM